MGPMNLIFEFPYRAKEAQLFIQSRATIKNIDLHIQARRIRSKAEVRKFGPKSPKLIFFSIVFCYIGPKPQSSFFYSVYYSLHISFRLGQVQKEMGSKHRSRRTEIVFGSNPTLSFSVSLLLYHIFTCYWLSLVLGIEIAKPRKTPLFCFNDPTNLINFKQT